MSVAQQPVSITRPPLEVRYMSSPALLGLLLPAVWHDAGFWHLCCTSACCVARYPVSHILDTCCYILLLKQYVVDAYCFYGCFYLLATSEFFWNTLRVFCVPSRYSVLTNPTFLPAYSNWAYQELSNGMPHDYVSLTEGIFSNTAAFLLVIVFESVCVVVYSNNIPLSKFLNTGCSNMKTALIKITGFFFFEKNWLGLEPIPLRFDH